MGWEQCRVLVQQSRENEYSVNKRGDIGQEYIAGNAALEDSRWNIIKLYNNKRGFAAHGRHSALEFCVDSPQIHVVRCDDAITNDLNDSRLLVRTVC